MLLLKLAALALAQTPATPPKAGSKIQIIRGKPTKQSPQMTEVQLGAQAQQPSPLEAKNKQRAAELDAKEKALAEKERELKEREEAEDDEKKKQAKVMGERQKAVQQQHQQNEAAIGDINSALSGD